MRSHVLQAVSDQDGNLLVGATITVLNLDGTLVDAPMYYGMEASNLLGPDGQPTLDDNGDPVLFDQTLSNPFTASDGVIEFWLDNPARMVLFVSPLANAPDFSVVYDALPPAPEVVRVVGTMRITNTPTPGQILRAADAFTAQWVDPPVTVTPPGDGGGGGIQNN